MKKGLVTRMTVMVIIGILVMSILIFVFQTFTNKTTEALDINICRNTLLLHSIELKGIPVLEKIKVKCPTIYETVGEESDEKIKKKILQSQNDCWYKMAADKIVTGEIDPFKDETTFCYVCKVFEFRQNRKIYGIGEYAIRHDSRLVDKNIVEEKISTIKNGDFIDTSDNYASIFVLIRGKDKIEEFMLRGGTYAGSAVLITVGAKLIAAGAGGIITPEPITTITGSLAVVTGGILAISGSLIGVFGYLADLGEPHLLLMTSFVKYNAEELNKLGCKEFPVYRN